MAAPSVTVQRVDARLLAAVRRRITIAEIGEAWRPALDLVWQLLRAQPELRADGHNVFLYHHPEQRNQPMDVDFGVEITRRFEPVGEVRPVETPAGEVALATHVGPYRRLREAHDAIHAWCAKERRSPAGVSWEIYGDFTSDESKLETSVAYQLR